MEEWFFVDVSRGGRMIGSVTASEIRERLAAGSFLPTFVCLPAEPAGDPSRRWRPLWAVFGLPKPEGAEDELPPSAQAAAVEGERPARTVEDRLAALEQVTARLRTPEESGVEVGWLLLTFGQLVSALGCLATPVYALVTLSQAAVVRERVPDAPNPTVWIIGCAVLGFLYSAAMFVVFTRCKRVPPE